MLALLDGANIRLTFRYSPDLISHIKGIPGRQWLPVEKIWLVPADITVVDILSSLGFAGLDDIRRHLVDNPSPELPAHIKTPLSRLGQLIVDCYLRGDIDQLEQAGMLGIINHLSLKDFVKY